MFNMIKNILDRNNFPYTFDGYNFRLSYTDSNSILIRPTYSNNLCSDLVSIGGFCFDIGRPYHLFELEDVLLCAIKGMYKVSFMKDDTLSGVYLGHKDMDILSFKKYVEELFSCKVLSVSSFDGTYTVEFNDEEI